MRQKRRTEGNTLIEVMVAVGLLSIGGTGLMAMQKTAATANGEGRLMMTASQVMNRWISRVRRDALFWNAPGVPVKAGAGTLLKASDINISSSYIGGWITPATVDPASPDADAGIDPGDLEWYAADIQGVDTKTASATFFCTHARLAWVVPNHALRVDLRTYWRRQIRKMSSDPSSFFTACATSNTAPVTTELGTGDISISSGKATKSGSVSKRLRAVYASTVLRWTDLR